MLKNILIILFLICPLVGLAKTDTLKIASADKETQPRTALLKFILTRNQDKALTGSFSITTNEDTVSFLLNNKIVADTVFMMQDSSKVALSKIYNLLGISESDLSKVYKSADSLRYGKIVFNHLINSVFKNPDRELLIVIIPQSGGVETAFFTNDVLWIIVSVLGVIIVALIYLYIMAKRTNGTPTEYQKLKGKIKEIKAKLTEKTQEKDLSDEGVIEKLYEFYSLRDRIQNIKTEIISEAQDVNVSDEVVIDKLINFYRLRDGLKEIRDDLIEKTQNQDITDEEIINRLCTDYFALIKSKNEIIESELEKLKLRQDHQNFVDRLNTTQEEEKHYFKSVSKAYIEPFVRYFRNETPYPADAVTRHKLIANLIPLAFHFISFVKLKNKEGVEYDEINRQLVMNPESVFAQLRTIDFSANLTNTDNKLVLHIIQLLKEYHVAELERVNINGYIIKNETSNE